MKVNNVHRMSPNLASHPQTHGHRCNHPKCRASSDTHAVQYLAIRPRMVMSYHHFHCDLRCLARRQIVEVCLYSATVRRIKLTDMENG